MRVLLINPAEKLTFPPLGLAYLAAVLEEKGHMVSIYDFSTVELTFEETVNTFKPDVLGISTLTHSFPKAVEVASKECVRNIPIIMGGPHASALPIETLQYCDYVVIGEGEQTLLELINYLKHDAPNNETLKNICGIVYKDSKSTPHITKHRPLISNLDEIPFPARHLLKIEKYSAFTADPFCKYFPATSVITSRGCPYNCYFCYKDIFGRLFRQRTPQNVIKELKELVDFYSVKEIFFFDDNFTFNKKWISTFCALLRETKLNLSWRCLSRVEVINRDLLRIMKKAGCHRIEFGIESGDSSILKIMRKTINLEQAKRAIRETKKAGITTQTFFILGNLGETPKQIKNTIKFAIELDSDFSHFFFATPLPGTELFHLANEKGLLAKDYLSINSLKHMNYFNEPVMEQPQLSTNQLRDLIRKAYSSFYTRPIYLLRSILASPSIRRTKINMFINLGVMNCEIPGRKFFSVLLRILKKIEKLSKETFLRIIRIVE